MLRHGSGLYSYLNATQDFFIGTYPNPWPVNVEYTVRMTKEEAIKRAGSQAALARILGVSRGAVNQWKQMPQGRVYQLMVIKPEWFVGA